MAGGTDSAGVASGGSTPPALKTSSIMGMILRKSFDSRNESRQPLPNGSFRVAYLLGRDFEGSRNHGLELDEIGDVIHERAWFSGMDEADRGCVAGR